MTSAFGYVKINGKILLVRHSYGRRNWHLPGGEVKRGEAPEHAALRELYEETGVIGTATRYFGNIYTVGHGTAHIYEIRPNGDAVPNRRPNREINDIGLFGDKALPKPISAYAAERIELCKNPTKNTYFVTLSRYSPSLSFDDAKNLTENYIDKAIWRVKEGSMAKTLGKSSQLDRYFSVLKAELLGEISYYRNPSPARRLGIKRQLDESYEIGERIVGGKTYKVFKIRSGNEPNRKFLINVIVPCRNSSKTVMRSLKFLLKDAQKSTESSFNVILFVNNTIDDTLNQVLFTLPELRLPTNCSIFVIESLNPTDTNSENINICKSIIGDLVRPNQKSRAYLSIWDDELEDRIPVSASIFQSNLKILNKSKTNKAISGYMIDDRRGVSKWHSIHNSTYFGLKHLQQRPIVHNGGGIVIRWSDISDKVISSRSMPGTDISAILLLSLPFRTLKRLDVQHWPLRINNKTPIFHPAEADILQWTAKYLHYFISWRESMDKIARKDPRIMKLWNARIIKNRRDIHNKVDRLVKKSSLERRLNREFMHAYYQTVDEIEDKDRIYSSFRGFRRQ
ncbi:MAG: NUDIX domain-containing protein [Candidatus Micrarchaeota archaeon]|nr:NUDIX domain-containing protein [Candidatus Micrarchaeota archaeon]